MSAAACGTDPAPGDCTTGDLASKLDCIPGLTITRSNGAAPAGYQRVDLTLTQAVDHDRPDAGTFTQRAVLFHTSDSAPMVLFTTGYGLPSAPGLTEVARTFGTNQITYEHRYFLDSRPSPLDWSKLDIKQAAGDAHHIVESFQALYPGRWLNTGGSKGGMASVYHRRFFPGDVDATLAYVAPTSDRVDDPKYNAFLAGVGGAERAACRAELVAFQRRLLEQRAAIEPLVDGTFTLIPRDKAFEIAVIELNFTFWQYSDPDDPLQGCALIPAAGASPDAMLAFLESHLRVNDAAGAAALDYFRAFFHQSGEQLGYPAPYEAPLAPLVEFPGLDQPATYVPPGELRPFDGAAMADVESWLASAGEQMMFLYGEFDPWSAQQFELGAARDSHVFVAAGGNHRSNLSQLSDVDRAAALAILGRWLDKAPVGTLRRRPLAGEPPDELGGMRPPL